MKERELEECEIILKENDKYSFNQRQGRLKELGILEIGGYQGDTSLIGDEYIKEASEAYINGCFRSCILCCSNIIEQNFKHQLINDSDDPEETYWEIETNKFTFGDIIKKSKNNNKLRPFIDDASWICEIRNILAVHPLYIIIPNQGDTKFDIIWKNKTMIRGIKKMLPKLDENIRKEIKSIEIHTCYRQDNEWKETTTAINDILNDPLHEENKVVWHVVQERLLKVLALESYKRMSKIMEGLYPLLKYINYL